MVLGFNNEHIAHCILKAKNTLHSIQYKTVMAESDPYCFVCVACVIV